MLNREIFTTLTEVKVLIEQWKREYNQVRPHSSIGYRSPASEVTIPVTLTQKVVTFMGVSHGKINDELLDQKTFATR